MSNLNSVFLDRMKKILGDQFADFLSSLDNPNEKAVFVNSNKIDVEKFKSIVDFDIKPIEYEKNGFYIGQQKLGRHPLHHAGAFYVQEPSAMFTVNAHKFKGDEIVLDMCSAPGGKSIQIANRIPNGVLVSNEINKQRAEILFSNIERMGLKNVIVANESPSRIADVYANTFDVVLVDAPCSGEGMFRKGSDIIAEWNENLPSMCAERQLDILESANRVLKQGGTLIYSTCTYSIEENENVVNEFIARHDYKLLNIEAELSRGINLKETVRLYPHIVKGEGQFVAVLRKSEENLELPVSKVKLNGNKIANEFIKQNTNLEANTHEYLKFSYIVPDLDLVKKNINYVSIGVRVGEEVKKRFEPNHNLFSAFGNEFKNKIDLKLTDKRVESYLKGETFEVDNIVDGYASILIEGCALGACKISQGRFKNHYPKGLRNFK